MKAAVTRDDRPTGTVELEMSPPGEGQFTIYLDSSGICGSDIHSLESLGSGLSLGHEFAGMITKLGAGVQDFRLAIASSSQACI
ncbi:alcohol dehydrogenase catalytic domain-containing protein [Pseudarthrobacter sp. 1G09]|uniref:alcohol dehydrogenase catalytic domain-containing protein n=1 Tax=Pseudarthrobacter sp. 1G09 TaxID=3416178 RepID=UPI003CEB2FDF